MLWQRISKFVWIKKKKKKRWIAIVKGFTYYSKFTEEKSLKVKEKKKYDCLKFNSSSSNELERWCIINGEKKSFKRKNQLK